MILRPQPGPQEVFLSTPADIAIYGGAAGGGKTYALLLECTRYIANPVFYPIIFRREAKQIVNQGGLWDTARPIFSGLGCKLRTHPNYQVVARSGWKLVMDHLNQENSVEAWQGSQIPLIVFDELTHFTRSQFFYMLSRNRSTSGVKPYIRAATNPDPDSWVAQFISWWWDPDTGYPIPERSGVLRWFVNIGDVLYWADTQEELKQRFHDPEFPIEPKSVTFVAAKLEDNKILMAQDPGYRANLLALDKVSRERLHGGNWLIRPKAGDYFPLDNLQYIDEEMLPGMVAYARGWDLAATEEDVDENPDGAELADTADWTVGVLLGKDADGVIYVLDVVRKKVASGAVRKLIERVAEEDGSDVPIVLPQDPGQAGKSQAESFVEQLSRYEVIAQPVSGSKITRAEPMASAWQRGNIVLVRAPWNRAYTRAMEAFPKDTVHDDDTDASSVAFNYIAEDIAATVQNFMVAGGRETLTILKGYGDA